MSFFSLSHCKLTAPSLTEDHDKIRATPPPRPNVKSQRKYIVSEFVYSLPPPLPQLLIIMAVDQVSYGSNVGETSSTDFSYISSEKLHGLLNLRLPVGMYSHSSTGRTIYVQFSSFITGHGVAYYFYSLLNLVKL